MYQKIIQEILEKKPNKDEITNFKINLCRKYSFKRIPSDIQIMLHSTSEELLQLKKYLLTKPVRTGSGVTPLAIMTKPLPCPHGKCTTCPGGVDSFFGDVPQSYTGNEPATLRGIRNNYDPYLQVFNRLEQYLVLGHMPDKIELIIMGGTFPSYPISYQDEFIIGALQAMNDFSHLFFKNGIFNFEKFKSFFELPGDINDASRLTKIHNKLKSIQKESSLKYEQELNEDSTLRCIALAIETRPDYALEQHINQMLKLGCTRVELGVQSLDNNILNNINRGHSVEDSILATKLMKNSLLKVGYHMMPGLPGSSIDQDTSELIKLFTDDNFKPDALKIYPCMVMPGTKLYTDWKNGKFKPLTTDDAIHLISKAKETFPKYLRVMRINRDIPTKVTSDGISITNLRQLLHQRTNVKCNCIRCREPRNKEISWGDVELKRIDYFVSGSKEIFLSYEDTKNDFIIAFIRLRIIKESHIPYLINSLGVRELHVYGPSVTVGGLGKIQHKGFGKKLMLEAEKIAKNLKLKNIYVISGIGVRNYYKSLGYKKFNSYMVKNVRTD